MSELLKNESFIDKLVDLAFRWEDEGMYEDIKDYQAPLQNVLKRIYPDCELGSMCMTASPFGFVLFTPYTYSNGQTMLSRIDLSYSVDDNAIQWKAKLLQK